MPKPLEILTAHYTESHDRYVRQVQRTFPNHDDAEDIVMESWGRATASIHTYDANRPFAPWFAAILEQRITEAKRGVKTSPLPTREEGYEIEDEIIERLDVANALRTLPAAQQFVLTECVVRGLTLREFGERLGISYQAAHERLQRAKAALKAALEAQA